MLKWGIIVRFNNLINESIQCNSSCEMFLNITYLLFLPLSKYILCFSILQCSLLYIFVVYNAMIVIISGRVFI
ncbi:hypothetical protein ECH_0909 [Ehrlichia chaffeensis str. Arkansas]|uniref:Uncharacterized protein n=1 Tax=Ehrlichia chaffeensis (strain ATCC CRL-10679 / Arkansas) TaxID=205920 RepID=Q2GFT2_EHRCR|nr:hypothetical protein ECH_0909 [Ehrlichia chaffeensis str. Arkansas]